MHPQDQSNSRTFQEQIDHIVQAFSNADRDLTPAEHRDIVTHSAHMFSKESVGSVGTPTNRDEYLQKLAFHAYKITDADIETLQAAGYSDDAIFEMTVGGALGVGLATWEKGLHAIDSFFADDDVQPISGETGGQDLSVSEVDHAA